MLDTLIRSHRDERPDGVACIDAKGTHVWRDMAALVDRFAVELRQVPRGSPALLVLPQRSETIALMAACAAAGINAVLASPYYKPAQLDDAATAFGLGWTITLAEGELVCRARVSAAPAPASEGGSVRVGLLTSGTTGQPKCAMHTWETLAAGLTRHPRFAGRRWLLCHPVAHFAGIQATQMALLNGGTLVVPSDLQPTTAVRSIVEHQVDYLNCTPSYLRQLLFATHPRDWAGARLRTVTLAGEIADQQVLDGIAAAVPGVRVLHIYGSTEMGKAIVVDDGKAGFDAALIDGQRFKIVDSELFVRRAERAMVGYAGQQAPGDEWIATGDMVEQVDGRVRFLGRADDIINVGGLKVAPAAVESVIRAVPGVVEVRVVPQPSSVMGQLVRAVLWVDASADQAAISAEVRRRCGAALAEHAVPRFIEFVDRSKLELSPTMKLVRRPAT